jgi:putative membrane protein
MLRRLPTVAAILAIALMGGGATALAHPGHHHHKHHGKRVSAWDRQWLMSAIEGDRFEIAGGKLAQDKGQSQQVRDLGARLVADHGKSLVESIKLAHRLHIKVPDSPSPSQQWQLQAVGTFSGNAFDRQYASLEVFDHVQDIKEASDEVKQGTNRRVRKSAKKEIPVLEQHLQLAKAALDAVGG